MRCADGGRHVGAGLSLLCWCDERVAMKFEVMLRGSLHSRKEVSARTTLGITSTKARKERMTRALTEVRKHLIPGILRIQNETSSSPKLSIRAPALQTSEQEGLRDRQSCLSRRSLVPSATSLVDVQPRALGLLQPTQLAIFIREQRIPHACNLQSQSAPSLLRHEIGAARCPTGQWSRHQRDRTKSRLRSWTSLRVSPCEERTR